MVTAIFMKLWCFNSTAGVKLVGHLPWVLDGGAPAFGTGWGGQTFSRSHGLMGLRDKHTGPQSRVANIIVRVKKTDVVYSCGGDSGKLLWR